MSAFITFLIAGIAVGCSYALVGSGLVVIHRITGVVNFAQGSLAVFGGLIAGTLLSAGLPHGLGEIVAALICGVIGLIIGIVALGRKGTTSMISLVITLGLSVLSYAVIIMIWGDGSHSSPGIGGSIVFLGATIQTHYFVVILTTVVTFTALGLFFSRSYLGKAMTACASNGFAARMVGINVRRMGLIAFAVAGILGGLAGVILTPLREVSYSSDIAFALNGFAAAVFGGLNSPGKTVIGGLVLGIVSLMVAGYVDSSYQIAAALILMLAVMIVRGKSLVKEEAK